MGRQNESRDKILNAAEYEFATVGYHSAGMDAIAERAGVAKGTLYYNFDGKAALFLAVVAGGLNELTRRIAKVAGQAAPIGRRLRSILEAQVQVLFEYPKIAAILFREVALERQAPPGIERDVAESIATLRSDYIDFIAELIREGVEAGEIKECDAELAAATLVEAVYAACLHVSDRGGDQGAAVAFLSDLLIHGLIRTNAQVPR
ncbi:MAG: TetR/AcrR family transcriptional regulator [Spirochaetaceae bacterium]